MRSAQRRSLLPDRCPAVGKVREPAGTRKLSYSTQRGLCDALGVFDGRVQLSAILKVDTVHSRQVGAPTGDHFLQPARLIA